jgi:transposase
MQMRQLCETRYSKEIELLKSISGVKDISAMIIIAETDGDMDVFENSRKIIGWAGLRPGNDESAGKHKNTATTKGNKYLRSVMVQYLLVASGIKNDWFKEKFNRLSMRKSRKKAFIAIAGKLLMVTWDVLYCRTPYNPLLAHVYDPVRVTSKIYYHQLEIDRMRQLLN